jgi:acetate---CoA ligase (ADP-forming)
MRAERPHLDLSPLLSPKSIAVVGASQKGGRATGALRNLLDLGFEGAIYPINPKYDSVLGIRCYPNFRSIAAHVDLVAIGIPSDSVLPVLAEAYEHGVKAAVVFASGFGEAGEAGRQREAELHSFAMRTGMLICGPNCLGMLNLQDRCAGYSSISPKRVLTGDVAIVSQSGTVIVALVCSERRIGFSHLISSGNEAGLTSADYLRYLVDQPGVRVLGAFIEGIKQPDRFIDAAQAARRVGKPLVVLKTGRSPIGSEASSAHTGSLAGSFEVHRAVFRQNGVITCDDLNEWIETIEIFRYARTPQISGIGLIGVSGGENALVLDHGAHLGLRFPPLSEGGKRRLASLLPWYARAENPIDPTGAVTSDPSLYRKCLEVLAAEPNIGVIAVSQDSPAALDVIAADATAEVASESNKCFVYFNNFSGAIPYELQAKLRDAGVPYLQGMRESLRAIKSFVDFHGKPDETMPRMVLHVDPERRNTARALLQATGHIVTEDIAKQIVRLYDLPTVSEIVAQSPEECAQAAGKVGYPVVAKVISPDIIHKAAFGGVRLNLNSVEEVSAAFHSVREAVITRCPGARISGILIQPQIASGIELILGIKRDAQFGTTIMIGMGGVLVEVIREFALRVVPISEQDAAAMIDELPALHSIIAKVRAGYDPRPTLTKVLMQLSALAAELGEDMEELDLNPVILDPATDRAVAVDALIVKRGAESGP